ncbi:hypothetical protein pVco7_gp009 [Vibrio phage pVco-7]|uniref:Uncharacterized protein n=1 Tax=Vibrio phage pVco-5 TaxID=1965485 RepID=A0A1W6JUQ2_9CAUD|nr:hypothetical protein KNT61_gp010 [Vibrio phage pVco-5]ARM70998.1 hypothetical protein pVco5_010 [Vibrio phage pVco-5]
MKIYRMRVHHQHDVYVCQIKPDAVFDYKVSMRKVNYTHRPHVAGWIEQCLNRPEIYTDALNPNKNPHKPI